MFTPITSQIYFTESNELGHNEICYTEGSSGFLKYVLIAGVHQWLGCYLSERDFDCLRINLNVVFFRCVFVIHRNKQNGYTEVCANRIFVE